MRLDNTLRSRGLAFAMLGLFTLLVVYSVLSFSLFEKAKSESEYATAVMQLTDQISVGISLPETASVLRKLETFRTGDSVRVAGETLNTVTLSEFLSPKPSGLEAIVQYLRGGELAQAAASAKELSASIDGRLDHTTTLIYYLQIAGILVFISVCLLVTLLISRLARTEDLLNSVEHSEANVEGYVTSVEDYVNSLEEAEMGVEDPVSSHDRSLRTSDDFENTAEASKSNTEFDATAIINAVPSGLLLLNSDYQIQSNQSLSLRSIFEIESNLEGDFFEFISQYVPQNTVQATREFMSSLYKGGVDDNLNPLNLVQIDLARVGASNEPRYLKFQFNAVTEQSALGALIVFVTDETERILLERELGDKIEGHEVRGDLLSRVLDANQAQFQSLFDSVEISFLGLNSTLKTLISSPSDRREKAIDFARLIYKLKSEAAASSLSEYELTARALEPEIVEAAIEDQALIGRSLLPVVTTLKGLYAEFELTQVLLKKIDQEPNVVEEAQTVELPTFSEQNGLAGSLQSIVEAVSERNGKRAQLTSFGLPLDQLPGSLQETVQSMLAQLVTNSIEHGATHPEERLNAGKTDFINIAVSLNQTDKAYTLLVRDDGEGFDKQAVLDRAIDLGIIESVHPDKVEPEDFFKLIFYPGFSTSPELTSGQSHGVGLNTLLKKAQELDGAIGIQYKHGRYCQFKITIPKRREGRQHVEVKEAV